MRTNHLPVPSHLALLCPPEPRGRRDQTHLIGSWLREGRGSPTPGQCPIHAQGPQGVAGRWRPEPSACALLLQLSFQRKVGILCTAGRARAQRRRCTTTRRQDPPSCSSSPYWAAWFRLKGFGSHRAQLDTKSEAQGSRVGVGWVETHPAEGRTALARTSCRLTFLSHLVLGLGLGVESSPDRPRTCIGVAKAGRRGWKALVPYCRSWAMGVCGHHLLPPNTAPAQPQPVVLERSQGSWEVTCCLPSSQLLRTCWCLGQHLSSPGTSAPASLSRSFLVSVSILSQHPNPRLDPVVGGRLGAGEKGAELLAWTLAGGGKELSTCWLGRTEAPACAQGWQVQVTQIPLAFLRCPQLSGHKRIPQAHLRLHHIPGP